MLGRRDLWLALASLAGFSAYNLNYGVLKRWIDNGAYVGGLISGLLIGMAVSPSAAQGRRLRRRDVLVYGLVLVLLMLGYTAVKKAREVVELEAARQALS